MEIINSNDLTNKYYEYLELEKIEVVNQILNEVKTDGDKAVNKYTKKFDNLDLENTLITKKQIEDAYKKVNSEDVSILKEAAKNITFFAKEQFKTFKNFEIKKDGVILGQKIIPIEKVGCYVPGGRYPLPSSALMSVIPAKVAGVKEIIVCSPKIDSITIVAADIAGADKIFNIGGIQAIGAMAYGTKLVPKVNKIVGPGNEFVAVAKKEVYGFVGIDFIAGPSEVLIIADETGNPEFIAADLLAQAEHDPNARCDLLTTSKELAEEVNNELKIQLEKLSTKDVAKIALNNGKIVLVNNLTEAIKIANRRAPEHLEIQVKDKEQLISELTNYGSLFIGNYSAEVFGDYCSGTNHTLPTNGASKYTGGLSVKDFIKILTYQEIDKNSCIALGKIASRMADLEGLKGHKNAADIRIKK
ncbi:MAG: histidinol dehydrogenase [DPANN group archaeon]|nr:histidinol dehydrogenase [DPANN group archaeon]